MIIETGVAWLGLCLALAAVLFVGVLPRFRRPVYIAVGVLSVAYGAAIVVLDPIVRRTFPDWGRSRRIFGYVTPAGCVLLGVGLTAWGCLGAGLSN